MKLSELQKHWDALGCSDPLWAILTVPEKRNRGWNADEFFAHGREAVERVLARSRALGAPKRHRRALDFGCGAGRIAQALSPHFERVTGVDIAPSMLELAARYNRYPQTCEYVLNERADLSRFADATFDFVYCTLVLQHIAPRYCHAYVTELVRVLAPGGLLHLQLPTQGPPAKPVAGGALARTGRVLARLRQRLREQIRFVPRMQMYATPEPVVRGLIESAGGRVMRMSAGKADADGWVSGVYCVTK